MINVICIWQNNGNINKTKKVENCKTNVSVKKVVILQLTAAFISYKSNPHVTNFVNYICTAKLRIFQVFTLNFVNPEITVWVQQTKMATGYIPRVKILFLDLIAYNKARNILWKHAMKQNNIKIVIHSISVRQSQYFGYISAKLYTVHRALSI